MTYFCFIFWFTLLAGLRSLLVGGEEDETRSSSSSTDGQYYGVESIQQPFGGVNFDKFDTFTVTIESTCPKSVQLPFESAEQVRESPTSTICFKGNLRLHRQFTRLTAIQKYIFPNMLAGSADLFISSPPSSGKSFAYITGLSQIITCFRERTPLILKRPPIALILAPTRESVLSIFSQMAPLLVDTGVRALYLYGTKDTEKQVKNLKQGVDIVISTPGRMHTLLVGEESALRLSNLRYLIMDDLDKILFPSVDTTNIGRMPVGSRLALATDFTQETVDSMLHLFGKSTPASPPPADSSPANSELTINKSTCRYFFFTSSIDARIRTEAAKYLSPNYTYLHLGDIINPINPSIRQVVLPVKNYTDKKIELIKHLKKLYLQYSRLLILVSERVMADSLSDYLNMNGFTSVSIHGNRSATHREMIIRDFSDNKIPLLVSTSLLARGIDLDAGGDASSCCLINFDFPDTFGEYVHAIGRTGGLGLAVSFFNVTLKQDLNLVDQLVQVLQESSQNVPKFLLDIQDKANGF